MQRWQMTLGLCGLALGAALIAPRLLPALGLVDTPSDPPVVQPPAAPALEPVAVVEPPVVQDEPEPEPRTIDLVIALDTSGSMERLIDSTRARLWDIVNEIDAQDPDATLRVGLITYGTPSYGILNHYVKVQVPLTTDLDAVYTRAWQIGTQGGDEYVGAVIDHALTGMDWAPADNPDNRRILFVAGNETAGLGPIPFRSAAGRAVQNDVIVNTLFAGGESAGVALRWNEVAAAGKGRFLAIDATQSAVAVATPYDKELEQLNSQLNSTYVAYDTRGAGKVQEIYDNDANASRFGLGSLASRIGTKGSKKHKVADWDLVEGLANGDVEFGGIDQSVLPANLQGLEEKRLEEEVRQIAEQRAAAKAEIGRIQAERNAYIREKAKKQEGQGLDEAMADVLGEQL